MHENKPHYYRRGFIAAIVIYIGLAIPFWVFLPVRGMPVLVIVLFSLIFFCLGASLSVAAYTLARTFDTQWKIDQLGAALSSSTQGLTAVDPKGRHFFLRENFNGTQGLLAFLVAEDGSETPYYDTDLYTVIQKSPFLTHEIVNLSWSAI